MNYKLAVYVVTLLSSLGLSGQSTVKIKTVNDTITRKHTLIFGDGIEIIEDSNWCSISISPDSQSVAILFYPNKRVSTVKILDTYARCIKTHSVVALSNILLANDKRFVMYGCWPTEDLAREYFIQFYDSAGHEVTSPKEAFGRIQMKFSDRGELAVLAEKSLLSSHYGRVSIFVFNQSFMETGRLDLNDFPAESPLTPPAFEMGLIKLTFFHRNRTKSIMILDLQARVKERRQL